MASLTQLNPWNNEYVSEKNEGKRVYEMSKKQNDEKEPKGQNVRAVVPYPDYINVNILVMVLYNGFARHCYNWGRLGIGYLSVLIPITVCENMIISK